MFELTDRKISIKTVKRRMHYLLIQTTLVNVRGWNKALAHIQIGFRCAVVT